MRNGKKNGEVILELDGISLSFGGIKALSDISFSVRKGEICSIIGPNGAGKSSLLNVINGVYHPQEGSIAFRGQRRKQMRPRETAMQGIARTFQNIALFKGMTVLDNIITGRTLKMKSSFLEQAFWLGRARREERENRQKAEEIIEFLQIQAIRKTLVGKLPYGLQKRVELGRALAAEPVLLLLDEPMAGMSVEEKQEMVTFITELHEEFGMTVVLIEHDIGVVMDVSDHIVVLDYGRKIADGPPGEIACNEEVIAAYLGTKAEKTAIEAKCGVADFISQN
ncbi:MAG: ABC transporter ATP-binding protein [Alphaproteobacteria bacterium]|uniref:ABC transporter ATP-binding protein n=1 Tax=Candidatus Nitrobium versatile TaxID=2884831 RepID=A0A953JAB6_9BACT|nr:ABC transporter ATP-binding protein [Candidatus Nitrobium versatile]